MQKRFFVLLAATSLLTACATKPETVSSAKPKPIEPRSASRNTLPAVNPQPDPHTASKPGGYYLDDGPPAEAFDPAAIPEPIPRDEPEHRWANRPYTVEGETVVPERGRGGYAAEGVASWYGKRFHGRKTSSGEKYDMYAFSAAHRTLPIPCYARVTNLKNGKSVIVRVNDRGPFHKNRLIDLSYAAAAKLGYVNAGSASVRVERILPGELPPPDATTLAGAATDAAASAQTVALPLAAGSDPDWDQTKIYWQLGAFRRESSANSFADSIRNHLRQERVVVASAPPLFRVLAGPYPDDASARADLKKIAKALGSEPVLLRPAGTVAALP